jgi:hypothetical protein
MDTTIPQITIHNKFASGYRQIHVDGAFGGITPRGLINLSFFAERVPIPKSSDFKIENNAIGALIENSADSKNGVLREYEFGVYMNPEVAKSIITMLSTQLELFENFVKDQQDATNNQ